MQPAISKTRGAHLGLLLVCLVLSVAVPGARAAQLPAIAPAASACERAALNDTWTIDLSASYSRSDSTQQRESEVSQSAGLTMVFEHKYDDENRVDWSATSVTGSGSVKGRDVSHRYNAPDEVHTTDGSGAPVKFSGLLRLNRATCTYDLNVWTAINATSTYTDSPPEQFLEDPLSFIVRNRPIPATSGRAAAPVLSFDGPMPVYVVTTPDKADWFDPASAAEGVRAIASFKGQETAGNATVSWAAKPNPDQPYIAKVSLTHSEVPTMQPLDIGQNGTVDGNSVLLYAKIHNPRAVSVSAQLRFLDAETNEVLPGCDTTPLLPPNYTSNLFCNWDTEGWAWDAPAGGGMAKAHPNHRIKIVLGSDADPLDSTEKSVVVRPKPVILVHDVNFDRNSWGKYESFLAALNPYWKAYAVSGMQMGKSFAAQEKSITISENALIMASYIRDVRVLENAWHVDIVAHGMGGIVAREYIDRDMLSWHPTYDNRPMAKHLVMLGTPNQGTECADIQLTLNGFTLRDNSMALYELTPWSMEYFNRRYTNHQGVKFSVLAGNSELFTCWPKLNPLSDGMVTVESAHYVYGDVGTTGTLHNFMPSDPADFLTWVFPRLAEGRSQPKLADAAPQVAAPAPRAAALANSPVQFTQVTSRTLAAGAGADIAVPVAGSAALRVAVMADAAVGATLRDPQGAIVQTIAPNSPAAQQGLRVFLVEKPAPGGWALHLENSGAETTLVAVGVMQEGGPLAVSAATSSRGDDGRATIRVNLTGGVGLAAAPSVSAELLSLRDGTRTPLALADDGAHGDGAAGDGVYGGITASLGDGAYSALVQIASGEERRLLTVPVAATPPPAASYSVFLPLVRR